MDPELTKEVPIQTSVRGRFLPTEECIAVGQELTTFLMTRGADSDIRRRIMRALMFYHVDTIVHILTHTPPLQALIGNSHEFWMAIYLADYFGMSLKWDAHDLLKDQDERMSHTMEWLTSQVTTAHLRQMTIDLCHDPVEVMSMVIGRCLWHDDRIYTIVMSDVDCQFEDHGPPVPFRSRRPALRTDWWEQQTETLSLKEAVKCTAENVRYTIRQDHRLPPFYVRHGTITARRLDGNMIVGMPVTRDARPLINPGELCCLDVNRANQIHAASMRPRTVVIIVQAGSNTVNVPANSVIVLHDSFADHIDPNEDAIIGGESGLPGLQMGPGQIIPTILQDLADIPVPEVATIISRPIIYLQTHKWLSTVTTITQPPPQAPIQTATLQYVHDRFFSPLLFLGNISEAQRNRMEYSIVPAARIQILYELLLMKEPMPIGRAPIEMLAGVNAIEEIYRIGKHSDPLERTTIARDGKTQRWRLWDTVDDRMYCEHSYATDSELRHWIEEEHNAEIHTSLCKQCVAQALAVGPKENVKERRRDAK